MELMFDVLSLQAKYVGLTKYENEFLTMKTLRNQEPSNSRLFRKCRLDWLNSLEKKQESKADRSARSISFRERGNKLYQAAPKRNALTACRLYTQAIFAAPLGECLALAHANRAMALQEFGYYQQAYDDCECALDLGYPDKLRHKLWTRQAFCARQLGDAVRLKQHLDKLGEQPLSEKFAAQIEELSQSMKQQMQVKNDEAVIQSIERPNLENQRQSQKILENNDKGRYMVTSKFIAENDLIFSESASSFVPAGEMRVCQQCASIDFIPFPCYDCHGIVVYCSLKCRRLHAATHAFECAAYQRDLFQHVGIAHLALRIVLDNIKQWSTLVRSKKSAESIWKELLQESGEGLIPNMPYGQSLRMITHLDKMALFDIIWFALVSEILVLYLSEFTCFFKALSETEESRSDIELITGSLILRHIGQLISNGHTCNSICRISNENTSDPLLFDLMSDNLWASPGHVLRGQLHQFSNFREVIVVNFPYLSLCNHSCTPSFQPKFSGSTVSTFAVMPIEAGEEIFNSYTKDFRKSRRNTRWNHLSKTYHFECKCFQCSKTNPDEEYNKFHRYRCNQAKCRQVFSPHLNQDDLNWWDLPEGTYRTDEFVCSICHSPQHWLNLHNNFKYQLECVQNKQNRQKLFKFFNDLDAWLLDYHQLKLFYAHEIVAECYAVNFTGFHLSPDEFPQLIKILKFLLRGIAIQNRINSIEYVAKMTYLWDFIALGRYKPTHAEMEEMLHAITITSDDMQKLFLNYYNDYIANKINA